MSNSRIVLTGTTGGLGSAVLKHILPIIEPSRIIVSLYNPTKSKESFEPLGVEVRKGDYSDPSSLEAAFYGAGVLLIVSSPSIAHKSRVVHHINAIDAAKRAGVRHIFYTSLAFAGAPDCSQSVAAVMRAHIDTEAYLKASGMAYTVIREGIYSESYRLYLGFFDPASDMTEVSIPDDGQGGIAWASRDELGEGTAKLLVEAANGKEEFLNKTVLFSGPQEVSLQQLADIWSDLLGRTIKLKYVETDEYATLPVVVENLGTDIAKLWSTTYEALARGECSVVDPLLENVLGRKPRDMRSILKELLEKAQSQNAS